MLDRAHMPKTMWETVKLPQNYTKALEVIDKRLQYWPKFATHKAKQRLTKITQYLIRMRKIRLRTKTRLVGINKKVCGDRQRSFTPLIVLRALLLSAVPFLPSLVGILCAEKAHISFHD